MQHFDRPKIIAILGTCLLGILLALPNFFTKEQVAGWPSWLPHSRMPLGLDLQGGAHMLLAMDSDQYKKIWLGHIKDDARKTLRDAKIGFSAIGVQGDEVQVRLVKPEDAEAARKELKKLIQPIGNALVGKSGFDLDLTQSETDPTQFKLKPTEAGLLARTNSGITASIETINRRINSLGTAEATVVQQGRDRILIQYPGISDTGPVKKLIGETAKLAFYEVHPTVGAEEAKATHAPLGYKVFEASGREESRGSPGYVLAENPVVDGEDLVDAQPGFDQRTNEPIISFRFNQSGARKFAKFTQEHVGEPFAIVLDDKVISAPVIREAILGGTGQISGSFTVESANNLAIQLRSGALPAKLTIVEERTVGPSLGADSIASGKMAALVGTLLVTGFMVFCYGLFGVFAVIAVAINIALIAAVMSLMGSTLTLPGIAGLVLNVGMAVDANVLIYERIREELRNGRTPIAAIDAGFERAFATIFDANLTHLIASLVMFWLGSGPVRGFAVTLAIGILTTLFTAFTVTRLLVSWWLSFQGRKVPAPL